MKIQDPLDLFEKIYAQAKGEAAPDAVALATSNAQGAPSVRMVLLKAVDARGFVFYTNLESRKAKDLAANPHAALCFYWPALQKQVRVEGEVVLVDDAEADAYFATRPRLSQIGAWASRQSQPLSSRAELEARVSEAEQRYAGAPVPRPPFWSGYRLAPVRIEFLTLREGRLHERELFERHGQGWRRGDLYP